MYLTAEIVGAKSRDSAIDSNVLVLGVRSSKTIARKSSCSSSCGVQEEGIMRLRRGMISKVTRSKGIAQNKGTENDKKGAETMGKVMTLGQRTCKTT